MKKYKVIALSVGGANNKIFHSQEIVSENQFAPGRADELVEKSFLEPINEAQNKSDNSEDDKYLEDLRKEYKSLSGKKADKRWKEDTLLEEIENLSK